MADVMNVYGHEGGFGLVAYHWENHTSLASAHHDGAAWSSGSAGSGSTGVGRGNSLYVPENMVTACLLYTSPSPRDRTRSRMPSSA